MKYVRRTSYDIKDNFIPNLLKDRGIINEDNEESNCSILLSRYKNDGILKVSLSP